MSFAYAHIFKLTLHKSASPYHYNFPKTKLVKLISNWKEKYSRAGKLISKPKVSSTLAPLKAFQHIKYVYQRIKVSGKQKKIC